MGSEDTRTLRVLAADDSAVMREVLRTVFAVHAEHGDMSLPRMELCGAARDGVEAVEQTVALRPDVLLLDLEMPRLNGLGVLQRLREIGSEVPVILCSTYTEVGARATLDGLAQGAKDYVTKPEHQRNYAAALESLRNELLPKIAALAGSAAHGGVRRKHWEGEREHSAGSGQVQAVVIGVSTGGPSALETILPGLPKDFPVPVLLVQHMPRLFTGALAERLNRVCRMPVEEARDGVELQAGKIWLAPGDQHMEVAMGTNGLRGRQMQAIRLRGGEALNGCMPSVDVLFRSAARVYGAGTLAVVLTGMGSDGLDGARMVRAVGGAVLAQDEASSVVWGMPARVADAGLASAVLPLAAMARELVQRVQRMSTMQEGRREAMYGVL